ncbi:MAG: lipopolysaccharide heptosyltransferase I [Phycisphaerales bacterium]|nr:lipopolysaccharide heptosyltransferase I [Phycisphaerales bacterium]
MARDPNRDGAEPRKILIIKPSSLGDIVHALPVLHGLRARYPSAHIAWLVATGFSPLLEGHPQIDELIRFDRARFGRMWRSPAVFLEFWRFVGEIRRRRFDLVVDLQGLIRSGLMAWLSGGWSVGFAEARELAWAFYSRRVRPAASAVHAVEKNLAIAAACGVTIDRPTFDLAVTDAERESARALLGAGRIGRADAAFLAVLPGARWASKQWPPARFSELIDRLAAEGRPRCVLLGAPSERGIADSIVGACQSPPVDLVGRTNLRQLAALLDLSEQVICLDSGPMHIAAALGKPLVALFGPTNPARTGPYSARARVVTHPVPCAPCYRRVCPLGHQDCLVRLDAAEVTSELQKPGEARSPAR